MVHVTRRESIKLASATALASLLSGGSDARAVEPVKGELMLMGPFSLGELYKSQERALGCYNTEGQVVSEDDIANAFNQCQLFIIDKKARSKSGEWEFADEGFPKIALSGKMHFELKDSKDSDFKIYFQEIIGYAEHTDYITEPATRHFLFNFQCHIVRGNLGSEKDICTYGWSPEGRIIYDINGKVLPKKP